MRMRSKSPALVGTICIVLSAFADKTHDVFESNKDIILSQPVTVCGEIAFAVGRVKSSHNSGSAVGYAKAEELAKWNIGNKYRESAQWPRDVLESEKNEAWLEYRCLHPERFTLSGMQRIWTKKTQPDIYTVVIGFPAAAINVPEPTSAELKEALNAVRERKKRIAAERARINFEKVCTGKEDPVDAMKQPGATQLPSPAKQNQVPGSQNDKKDEFTKSDYLNEDLML